MQIWRVITWSGKENKLLCSWPYLVFDILKHFECISFTERHNLWTLGQCILISAETSRCILPQQLLIVWTEVNHLAWNSSVISCNSSEKHPGRVREETRLISQMVIGPVPYKIRCVFHTEPLSQFSLQNRQSSLPGSPQPLIPLHFLSALFFLVSVQNSGKVTGDR